MRHQLPRGVVVDDNTIAKTIGKRASDTVSHGRDQTDPRRAQSRGKHGDAENHTP